MSTQEFILWEEWFRSREAGADQAGRSASRAGGSNDPQDTSQPAPRTRWGRRAKAVAQRYPGGPPIATLRGRRGR